MASGKKTLFIVLAVGAGLFFLATLAVMTAVALTGESASPGFGAGVGLVEVVGPIVSSDEPVRLLNKYRDNKSVKAIVLRVESPGGGVAASQEIYEAVWRARDRKPVVCSMGEVAASGGYYIACACDTIVANPGTLTGSIGALMEFMTAEELIRKVGLRFEVVKAGEVKDIGSISRKMTPAERAMLQSMLDDVHLQFMEAVAEGRGIDLDSLRTYADGRVFTGRQAWYLGLVDTLGTLDDALTIAGRMGGLKDPPRVIREKKRKRSLYDLLFDFSETASKLDKGTVGLKYLLR
ncbi:MAG TPA: signal peptide peptidase SppA [candidate division Zixibacteria bacterium]|jgi:protease-4|nr:signal peptide peptidase SppA [candidate division Zixibacteria bacterium]